QRGARAARDWRDGVSSGRADARAARHPGELATWNQLGDDEIGRSQPRLADVRPRSDDERPLIETGDARDARRPLMPPLHVAHHHTYLVSLRVAVSVSATGLQSSVS